MKLARSDALSVWLQERLADHAATAGVVGATAAIVHGDEIAEAATGVVNLSTRVAATTDAIFQIGSISKLFTTALVLQQVEKGRVGLDDPVQKHLPDFAVASDEISRTLTVRRLLTHTSGIDGEFFPETGSDSDAIQRYVQKCRTLGQVHAPGASTSYCNAAFVILGAMLERITAESWDTLVRNSILAPLKLTHVTSDWAELPRYRTAVGHLPDGSGALGVASRLHLPRGMGPTGATLHSSARDLARVVRGFFGDVDEGGQAILSDQSAALATTRQAGWPTTRWTRMDMGLGWQLHEWDGQRVLGHDGGTFGQSAFMRMMPAKNLTVVLLTNGGQVKNLYHALFGDIFRALAQVSPRGAPKIPDRVTFDNATVIGTYTNALTKADVFDDAGQLKLRTSVPAFAGVINGETRSLIPIGDGAFLIADPAQRVQDPAVFHDFEGGKAKFACIGHRELPRHA